MRAAFSRDQSVGTAVGCLQCPKQFVSLAPPFILIARSEVDTIANFYLLLNIALNDGLHSCTSTNEIQQATSIMGTQFSQFFPPQPTFTEADIGTQHGKVFLITGGYSGIGFEVAKILYDKGGKVYIAGRSQEKAQEAIREIKSVSPTESGGSLAFLALELDNLTAIKEAVDAFKEKETKLDVLWNNAGVSQPPPGSQSKQGFELQLATNCLGPFLLTRLLLPLLEKAAEYFPDGTTVPSPGNAAVRSPENATGRVIWLSSQIMELSAPTGAIIMSELNHPPSNQTRNYVNSKTGNYLLACELARRDGLSKGIISVSVNPGAASTSLFRHSPWLAYLAWPLLHNPKLAAYTELYAGLSPDINLDVNGCYVVPWGRIATWVRNDLVDATKPKEEGGTARAAEFWDFCERITHDYAG
jgi:NAD(P)-dependent dehydrogenase (short-subunit alcohol dehydrogenase family)